MKFDDLTVEILKDGTIRTTTDKVSAGNHSNSAEFLKMIGTLTGGPVDIKKRDRSTETKVTNTQSQKG